MSRHHLRAVLFDMDGTLLDSAPDFLAVCRSLHAAHALPEVNEQAMCQVVSGGAGAMVRAAFNLSEHDSRFEPLRHEFLERYLEQCAVYSRLYDGIGELLDDLDAAKLPWGVATNKHLRFAAPIMQRLKLAERAKALLCPDHVARSKPAPDMLLAACAQLKVEPQHCLFVGDDLRDIQAGQAAGCKTVAVTYGYIHPDDNPSHWGADHLVESPTSLRQLIDRALCGC